jgi:nitrate reductase NapAB chaperone NapD
MHKCVGTIVCIMSHQLCKWHPRLTLSPRLVMIQTDVQLFVSGLIILTQSHRLVMIQTDVQLFVSGLIILTLSHRLVMIQTDVPT